MPQQEEHDRPENLVEAPHKKTKSATSLEDEANSNNSLEGYAAMNGLNNEEIGRKAEELEQEKEAQQNSGK